jgi:hypothetical protein
VTLEEIAEYHRDNARIERDAARLAGRNRDSAAVLEAFAANHDAMAATVTAAAEALARLGVTL